MQEPQPHKTFCPRCHTFRRCAAVSRRARFAIGKNGLRVTLTVSVRCARCTAPLRRPTRVVLSRTAVRSLGDLSAAQQRILVAVASQRK